jgi:ribosomal protein S18 acetylase RimI-like enzyme
MIRESKQSDIPRIAETTVFSKRMALRLILCDDKFCFENLSVVRSIAELKKADALKNLFVYDDGIVKGVLKLEKSGSKFEIGEIYVDPFFQQNRIGNELVSFAENRAKSKGAKELEAFIYAENSGTLSFFEALGFQKNGATKISAERNLLLIGYSKKI